MSEEKPKYIRKKCEHDKYSFQCKECKGASICDHNRIRSLCKEWSKRLETLQSQIEYWCAEDHKTDKTLEIIQLFYDNEFLNTLN